MRYLFLFWLSLTATFAQPGLSAELPQPFQYIIEMNEGSAIEYIKKNPESVNRALPASQGGATPLIIATTRQQSNLVQALLDFGADTNAVDFEGKTALLYAVMQNNEEIVQKILNKSNASVNIASRNFGETPLHQAYNLGNMAIGNLLMKSGANPHYRVGLTPSVIELCRDFPGDAFCTSVLAAWGQR